MEPASPPPQRAGPLLLPPNPQPSVSLQDLVMEPVSPLPQRPEIPLLLPHSPSPVSSRLPLAERPTNIACSKEDAVKPIEKKLRRKAPSFPLSKVIKGKENRVDAVKQKKIVKELTNKVREKVRTRDALVGPYARARRRAGHSPSSKPRIADPRDVEAFLNGLGLGLGMAGSTKADNGVRFSFLLTRSTSLSHFVLQDDDKDIAAPQL